MTGPRVPRELEQEAFDAAQDRIIKAEREDLLDGFGEDGPEPENVTDRRMLQG